MTPGTYVNRTADLAAAIKLGLTEDEYEHIKRIQDREPTYVELAIYSLMWSEHCSYKHSRPILGRFPTSGPRILQGPGENAGIIDVGDGWAVAMKVESHNHPSAVEPFQGAATGVGGIVRDIFTMGARPCVSMDSLRFGELTEPRQRFLLDGVVGGIAHYGNCLGIPTVGGEIYFEPSYEGNCLVNAFSAGLIRTDGIVRAIASGVGNHVVLIGSKTGRDGIGGASVLASQEFDETLEEKRPSVQVGDPFTEKKLIEACLELIHRKLVVSMQDLGAAGLTSSSSEMSSKGHVGLDIHADRVPLREADMEPWEIMISESQERMLAIVTEEQIADVREVCERWDLDCTVIGEVTDSKMLRIIWHGERVADIPARRLADESPVIRTPSVKPDYIVDEPVAVTDAAYPPAEDAGAALLQLMAAPNIASKRWAWEQYDYIVQANTMQIPGSDAAVLRIKGTDRGFAFSNDCNGRHCYLDPYRGAKAATAEAARNLACSGALPVAVTDCLNFGNPEKGEIYWQFEQAIEGMAEACEALDTPVVSGNVSFYNESFGQAIYPTPMVGMLGIFDDVSVHIDGAFKDEGDVDHPARRRRRLDGRQRVPEDGLRQGRGADPGRRPGARGEAAGAPARSHRGAPSQERARLLRRRARRRAGRVLRVQRQQRRHGHRRPDRASRPRPLPRRRGGPRLRRGRHRRRRPAGPRPVRRGADARGRHLRGGQGRRAGGRPRRPPPPYGGPGCRCRPAVYHGGQGALRRPGERAPFCV